MVELKPSELRCLRLIARGFTIEDVSVATGWPADTVREQLESARRKLAARNTTHAVAIAVEAL